MSEYDLTKGYIKYNEDVLSGRIVASKNIILAAQRFKNFFSREDVYFDYEDVDRRIRFCSKIKQYKDRFNGKPLILLPWQEWIFANIFGLKWCEDGTRVTRKVLLFVARKAGKTALSAALCLVQLFLDNNNGQEIDLVASSTKQAKGCLEYVQKFGSSLDPSGRILKPFRDTVKMPITSSVVAIRNSDGQKLDGLNPSTFIFDELHAAKTQHVYDVLKSGQGFQSQPLAIIITTAGYLIDGYPLFEMRKVCVDILKGVKSDDEQFSALYELDEGDDWTDSSLWIKANPALGETVPLRGLLSDYTTAVNMPWTVPEFKSKHLNIFCKDTSAWIEPEFIRGVMKPIPWDELRGGKEVLWAGVDLSTTWDLTCFCVMFTPNKKRSFEPDKYIFSVVSYVTERALQKSSNRDLYQAWINQGYLKLIDGNAIDYEIVKDDLLKYKEYGRFDTIGYDIFNASQFVISCQKAGLELAPFSQKIGSFNGPTKEFERLIFSDSILIEYNPLIVWCFNNVELVHQKGTDNIKPDKGPEENKIDAVIGILEALGTYLYITGKLLGDTEIYGGKEKEKS